MSVALSQVLQRCAPRIGSRTMSAIVAYESGGRPNAIGDNTARRSYFPAQAPEAQALGEALLRSGHNIDVGYAQINSANFAAYHLTVARALEPCSNVATGSSILLADYAAAARVYGPGQTALVHALSAYNTGGYRAGLGYAHGVYAAARALRYEPPFGQPADPAPFAAGRAYRFHRAAQSAAAAAAPVPAR